MLKREDIDAVIVSTPNVFLAEISIAAAEANKNILCEKPMALNLLDAKKVVLASEKSKIALQVGYVLRYWAQNKSQNR